MAKSKTTVVLAVVATLFTGSSAHAQENKTNLKIQKVISINVPVAQAWKVLGPEFPDASIWATAVAHSEGKGTGINGASCSERACETTMGALSEKITVYSPEKHLLSYQVYHGMPKMVKYAQNTWQLTTLADGKTQLTMTMEMRIGGIGKMMKPMMKMKLSKMGNELTEEFKYYVENGKPHPRKVKAVQKQKK